MRPKKINLRKRRKEKKMLMRPKTKIMYRALKSEGEVWNN